MTRLTFKTKPEHTTWRAIADMWEEGERIELFDGGWLYDHFYPIYGDQSGPCFEGWTAWSVPRRSHPATATRADGDR